MTVQSILLLFSSVLASSIGQLMLKLGSIRLATIEEGNFIHQIVRIITIPELLIGLGFYGVGAISYILLLTRVKLSVAAPSISLVYVFTVLIGFFIFKENIPLTTLIGLAFIILGVILVASN
ncbi:MAG: EamA family transporter [Cyanobacteria bacterium P01_C01_bin.118]